MAEDPKLPAVGEKQTSVTSFVRYPFDFKNNAGPAFRARKGGIKSLLMGKSLCKSLNLQTMHVVDVSLLKPTGLAA